MINGLPAAGLWRVPYHLAIPHRPNFAHLLASVPRFASARSLAGSQNFSSQTFA